MTRSDVLPESVFTPRSAEVNTKTYVNRPGLENALTRGLRSGLHLVISGQSGSGKTWLYRYALPTSDSYFEVINLSSVSNSSFQTAFEHIESRVSPTKKTQRKEKKQVRGNIGVAQGQFDVESTFEPLEQCNFYRCIERIYKKSKRFKRRCLVFDNLESIIDNRVKMKELADYLILLDDPAYAKFNVQLILVGVPVGVRGYFREVVNMESVANRLREIPEVTRLDEIQVTELVSRGFLELNIDWESDIKVVADHVHFVTDGLPQRIHEYCFELAELVCSTGIKTVHHLSFADRRWLKTSMMQAYEIVVGAMNTRKKQTGKRNQVLYALGRLVTDEFDAQDVNNAVKSNFYTGPDVIQSFSSNNVLRDLVSRNNPIICRTATGNNYRFTDPRYRMALRTCLRKEQISFEQPTLEKPSFAVVALEMESL